jgi:hypothetical protein
MRRGRIIKAVVAGASSAAIFAGGALAAGGGSKNLLQQGYDTNKTPTVQVGPSSHTNSSRPSSGVLGAPPASRAVPARRGSLPFTGVDLALMTAGGLTLLALGAGLRRAARSKA